MREDLREFVMNSPVFDVHEHHMPDIVLRRDVGLLRLFWQSYAGWTQARPYPLASEAAVEDPMLASLARGGWAEIARFVEQSGSSSFVRHLAWALSELYELGDQGITPDNWEALDAEIHRRHAR